MYIDVYLDIAACELCSNKCASPPEIFDSFNLRVVFERDKTGFEESKAILLKMASVIFSLKSRSDSDLQLNHIEPLCTGISYPNQHCSGCEARPLVSVCSDGLWKLYTTSLELKRSEVSDHRIPRISCVLSSGATLKLIAWNWHCIGCYCSHRCSVEGAVLGFGHK